METPQLREKSLEPDHEDRVDSNETTCQTCSTLQSSVNPASSTCSHGSDSGPNESMDENEPAVSKVPIIKQGCSDSHGSTEHFSSDLDFGHDGPGSGKDNGDGDMGNNSATSKGETEVVKRSLSETDIGDKCTGSPDNCSNKGGHECDVDKSGGTSGNSSATDESVPNLHRDNLLRMVASDSLSEQRPGESQTQQEQGGTEAGNPDEDSCSVQFVKGQQNVEPLAVGSDAEDSSPVAPEKAKRGEEFQVPNIQHEGSGPIDLVKESVEEKSPSAGNHPQDSNYVAQDKARHDVESLATDNIRSAANDPEKAKGEGMEEMAAAEIPEAGSELEKQMMARLLEIESGPSPVKDDEELEDRAWTIGREWREGLWNMFLFVVVFFAMVMWNLDSSSASVAPTPATVKTSPTVQTRPAPSTLPGAMNSMGARICLSLFDLEPTPRIGHASDEDSMGQTNNGGDKKSKAKHAKKEATQNNSKNTSNAKNQKTNKEGGDRPAASQGKGEDKRSSHADQPQAQTRAERWRERWAAWAVEFEELVDGPWV